MSILEKSIVRNEEYTAWREDPPAVASDVSSANGKDKRYYHWNVLIRSDILGPLPSIDWGLRSNCLLRSSSLISMKLFMSLASPAASSVFWLWSFTDRWSRRWEVLLERCFVVATTVLVDVDVWHVVADVFWTGLSSSIEFDDLFRWWPSGRNPSLDGLISTVSTCDLKSRTLASKPCRPYDHVLLVLLSDNAQWRTLHATGERRKNAIHSINN